VTVPVLVIPLTLTVYPCRLHRKPSPWRQACRWPCARVTPEAVKPVTASLKTTLNTIGLEMAGLACVLARLIVAAGTVVPTTNVPSVEAAMGLPLSSITLPATTETVYVLEHWRPHVPPGAATVYVTVLPETEMLLTVAVVDRW